MDSEDIQNILNKKKSYQNNIYRRSQYKHFKYLKENCTKLLIVVNLGQWMI